MNKEALRRLCVACSWGIIICLYVFVEPVRNMKAFENIIWEFNLFIYFAVALTCHKAKIGFSKGAKVTKLISVTLSIVNFQRIYGI